MDFKDYQQQALLTSSQPDSKEKAIAIWCMGLAGETGEAIDYLKKVVAHGHQLDKNKIALELGDILWYLAVLAEELDLDLEAIATKNIEKLKARYPQGFSSENSINRINTNSRN
ncbi:nucleoside triphosphate pyrophosphohydrolase family protein [Myxosarcina sp. GI1]|uniref:nucleoside triphosphate pyrophosphohydrolase family protein n=1 Tax=Myxosarcina sp. GI1 TaxID=1541065 RepID=UPI0005619889|nr:nucleoside triphosphate pyrophosphohydrolase family protein [Myxosarcina sp. GI1]